MTYRREPMTDESVMQWLREQGYDEAADKLSADRDARGFDTGAFRVVRNSRGTWRVQLPDGEYRH